MSRPFRIRRTNDARLGYAWFCQLEAVPDGQGIDRYAIPAARAKRRATARLGPQARTTVCGWWYQSVTSGRKRRTTLRAKRDSGSDSGTNWWWLVLVVAVLGGGGFAFWWFYWRRRHPGEPPAPTEPPIATA